MDGSIHEYLKKGKKHYYVSYRVADTQNNQTKQKSKRGFKTRSEAKKFLVDCQHSISEGTYIDDNKTTLATYLRDWLIRSAENNLAQSTIDGYRTNIVKHILPNIGHIELKKLKPFDIESMYSRLRLNGRSDGKGGLSGKSLLYIHRTLHKALNDACKNLLISRNVVSLVTSPKTEKYKHSFYGRDEIIKLLDIVKNSDMEMPVALAVILGLRRGEVLGLTWDKVIFKNNSILIDRQYVVSSKGHAFKRPKDDSIRSLALPDLLKDILIRHKRIQKRCKLMVGENYKDNNLVCCKADGEPYSPNTLSHKFANTLKDNALPHIRFHDLRHSAASLMLTSGVNMKVASKRLGHSTMNITSDLYSHVEESVDTDAAKKINATLSIMKVEEPSMPVYTVSHLK